MRSRRSRSIVSSASRAPPLGLAALVSGAPRLVQVGDATRLAQAAQSSSRALLPFRRLRSLGPGARSHSDHCHFGYGSARHIDVRRRFCVACRRRPSTTSSPLILHRTGLASAVVSTDAAPLAKAASSAHHREVRLARSGPAGPSSTLGRFKYDLGFSILQTPSRPQSTRSLALPESCSRLRSAGGGGRGQRRLRRCWTSAAVQGCLGPPASDEAAAWSGVPNGSRGERRVPPARPRSFELQRGLRTRDS